MGICIDESIRRARTCAFIALVWAEGFRAYVSRSFENPVWVDTFANPSMNKAVLLAQLTLGLALFIPCLSDSVLGLYVYEIHGFGWFLAAMGSISCLVFCELFKCWSKRFVELAEIVDYTEDEDGNQKSSTEPSAKVVTKEPVEEKKEPVEEKKRIRSLCPNAGSFSTTKRTGQRTCSMVRGRSARFTRSIISCSCGLRCVP